VGWDAVDLGFVLVPETGAVGSRYIGDDVLVLVVHSGVDRARSVCIGTFFNHESFGVLEVVQSCNVLSEVKFRIEICRCSCSTSYRCYWNYSLISI
jgi:hypothetical protein